MSEIMLLGILCKPYPDDPAEMAHTEWHQARAAMREAADEIERLRNGLQCVISGAEGYPFDPQALAWDVLNECASLTPKKTMEG